MKKLITLSNLLRKKSLHREAGLIIRLASNLKRLELAEVSEEPLGEIGPRDIAGTDSWMKWVAHDLSEILGLHAPTFLGSSARDRFGRGAYAFSASNDAGESVVLKIGLAGEIRPYQKAMRMFGEDPPSIFPRIYAAGFFDDIGYKPPVNLANDFGYIVMEELEPMPKDMAKFLQDLGSSSESFRFITENKNELRRLINLSAERIDSSLKNKITSPLLSEDEVNQKVGEYLSDYKEALWNKSFEWKGSDNREVFSDLIYHDFYHTLNDILRGELTTVEINNLSERAAAGFLSELNSAPVQSSYKLNTPLGRHFSKSIEELEEMGIEPGDLHADNIMLRPETGEIVISDLGHFGFGFM